MADPRQPRTPPKNDTALRELVEWKESTDPDLSRDIRRAWLFMTEAEALARFGTPDQIHRNDGEEVWVYEERDDEGLQWRVHLRFFDGRLKRVD